MKRLLYALLLIAAFLFGVLVPPVRSIGTAAPDVQLPGRGDITPTPDDDPIVEVILVHASGRQVVLPVGVLVSQTPSPTPAATDTPAPTATLIPTNTLRATTLPGITPSKTPYPTFTPTATDDFQVPTQESTPLPTVTPGPTAIPKVCELRAFYTINIRNAINGVWVGSWNAGDYRTFDQFVYVANGYTWGHSPTAPGGWTVIYNEADMSASAWWVSGTATSGTCYEVDGWPSHVMPPGAFARAPVAWLIHTVPGYNDLELRASYLILASKGIDFGVKPYASIDTCLYALDAGGVCIYRYPVSGDCPAQIGTAEPVASARDWMQKYSAVIRPLMGYAQSGRLWIEIVNECYYGSGADIGVFYWWGTWLETAVDYAVAHDWPPLVAPTFGPGYGDDALQYLTWKPALLKLAASDGMIGYHAYTPHHNQGLCACDEWTACRHRRNYATLLAQGIDLHYAITEAARGWGNDPVSENDFECWYDQIKYDPGLHSIAAWVGGYHPAWPLANLDNHYVSLAQRIAP